MAEAVDCDVVILGAGAAGLTVAKELAGTDLQITLLEARDRVGGRVQSVHLPGWSVPLEAGAEFIHGQPPAIWDVVRATHLAAYEVSEHHWHAPGGELQPFDFASLWDRLFDRLPQFSDPDCSFEEFLNEECADLTREERAHLIAFVEGFNAADSRLISCHWIRETGLAIGRGGNASSFRIQNGYDTVIHWLLSGVDFHRTTLRLNTMAETIRWGTDGVEIGIVSRTGIPLQPVRARQAVVTLPLGVLRAAGSQPGAVRFLPDLQEKWAAAAPLKMGSVIKIVLRFRHAFWEPIVEGRMGLLDAPEESIPAWWTTDPMRTSILTGWVGGPLAERLASRTNEAILVEALSSLGRTLKESPEHLAELLQDWHVFNWERDPYARGAYSYVSVGGLKAPERFAAPVRNILFFAGEATHNQLNGTVGGAIASGQRAARELLSAKHVRLRTAV